MNKFAHDFDGRLHASVRGLGDRRAAAHAKSRVAIRNAKRISARPQSSEFESRIAGGRLDGWHVQCSIDVESRLDVRLSDRSGEVIAHAQRDLMDTAPGASRPAGLKDAEEVLSHFFESLGASSSSDPARMMTMAASGVRMTTTDADGVTTKPFAMDSMFGIKAHTGSARYPTKLSGPFECGNAYLVAPKCDAPNRRIVAFVSLAELGNADGDLYPSTTQRHNNDRHPAEACDRRSREIRDGGCTREGRRPRAPTARSARHCDGWVRNIVGVRGSAVPFLIVGSSSSETTLSAHSWPVVDAARGGKGKSEAAMSRRGRFAPAFVAATRVATLGWPTMRIPGHTLFARGRGPNRGVCIGGNRRIVGVSVRESDAAGLACRRRCHRGSPG